MHPNGFVLVSETGTRVNSAVSFFHFPPAQKCFWHRNSFIPLIVGSHLLKHQLEKARPDILINTSHIPLTETHNFSLSLLFLGDFLQQVSRKVIHFNKTRLQE